MLQKTLCRVHYLQGISNPFEIKFTLKEGMPFQLHYSTWLLKNNKTQKLQPKDEDK